MEQVKFERARARLEYAIALDGALACGLVKWREPKDLSTLENN